MIEAHPQPSIKTPPLGNKDYLVYFSSINPTHINHKPIGPAACHSERCQTRDTKEGFFLKTRCRKGFALHSSLPLKTKNTEACGEREHDHAVAQETTVEKQKG